MEDILGIKKPEVGERPNREAATAETPAVASANVGTPAIPANTPVAALANATTPTAKPEEVPTEQSAGDTFRNSYQQSGDFMGALNQTFTTREVVDERRVKARKNLAGLADFATSLGDIFSSSIGGNVEQRKSSAMSDFDNKLVNYRRQLEDRNRQHDMLAYQAKVMDIQDRIRRGDRMEDILHRDKREKMQDQRYLDGKNWQESQAEESARRWNRSTEIQEQQIKQGQRNFNATLGLQRERVAAQELATRASLALKHADSGSSIGLFVGDKRFNVPKNDWEGLALRAQKIMKEENPEMFGSDMETLSASLNEPNARKAQALVMATLGDYPKAAKFVADYLGGGKQISQEEVPSSYDNPIAASFLPPYNGPVRNGEELARAETITANPAEDVTDSYEKYVRSSGSPTEPTGGGSVDPKREVNNTDALAVPLKANPYSDYKSIADEYKERQGKESEAATRKEKQALEYRSSRLNEAETKIKELEAKLVQEVDIEQFIEENGIDPISSAARNLRGKARDYRINNATIEREIQRISTQIARSGKPIKFQ